MTTKLDQNVQNIAKFSFLTAFSPQLLALNIIRSIALIN